MATITTILDGKQVDITRYVEMLEFYGKDEYIEMLEDIAFAYSIHYLENADELSMHGTPARLDLLHQLIGSIRDIKQVE